MPLIELAPAHRYVHLHTHSYLLNNNKTPAATTNWINANESNRRTRKSKKNV